MMLIQLILAHLNISVNVDSNVIQASNKDTKA